MADGRDKGFSDKGLGPSGYLADGSGGKPAPGILVIHDAIGLGPNERNKADLLAAMGYVAFAADLFGQTLVSMDDVIDRCIALMNDIVEWRARLDTALDALRNQPNVDGSKLAAIGFCFGGSSVIELARSGADVKAVVGFHCGLGMGVPADSRNIRGSVLVCNGDADPQISKDQRDAFLANMAEHKVDCQMLLMAGVGHSFTNPDAAAMNLPGTEYDARAERRSWAAMKDLFDEAFGEPCPLPNAAEWR